LIKQKKDKEKVRDTNHTTFDDENASQHMTFVVVKVLATWRPLYWSSVKLSLQTSVTTSHITCSTLCYIVCQ